VCDYAQLISFFIGVCNLSDTNLAIRPTQCNLHRALSVCLPSPHSTRTSPVHAPLIPSSQVTNRGSSLQGTKKKKSSTLRINYELGEHEEHEPSSPKATNTKSYPQKEKKKLPMQHRRIAHSLPRYVTTTCRRRAGRIESSPCLDVKIKILNFFPAPGDFNLGEIKSALRLLPVNRETNLMNLIRL